MGELLARLNAADSGADAPTKSAIIKPRISFMQRHQLDELKISIVVRHYLLHPSH